MWEDFFAGVSAAFVTEPVTTFNLSNAFGLAILSSVKVHTYVFRIW